MVTETVPEGKSRQLGEKLGVKLGESEEKILHLLIANKFATINIIAQSIGISTTAVENNLIKLKGKGLLRRIGPDKGGHWEIVGKNNGG